jgi:hypothetical protein
MIKSDAQRDRTLIQIEGFRQALSKVDQEKPGKRSTAIRGSYEGMIRQLEDDGKASGDPRCDWYQDASDSQRIILKYGSKS